MKQRIRLVDNNIPILFMVIILLIPIVLLINFISDKLSSINYDKFFRMPNKNTQTNNMEENVK